MNPVLIISTMALQRFDNETLAAFNNAVNGFLGKVPPVNMAYQEALAAGIIHEDGNLVDECVREASAFVVNERVAAGTFV